MNFQSGSTAFNFPVNTEDTERILEVERTAKKALKNITLLYNEIMTPKECNSEEESETIINNLNNASLCSHPGQSHYVKSCCTSVRELCFKCERFVSRCSSCNRCKCSESKLSFNRQENNENADSRNRLCYTPESDYKIKCTVPRPFSLYSKNEERQKVKQEKILKMKQNIEEEIEKELQIRASCKPVPKSTYLPLYKQMVQEKEKHKEKRKEKCLEILNSTKPFTLHSSSRILEKTKSSSDLTQKNDHCFKAKPAPKHILSPKVSEKLKNKEEVRKMLMSERAKQIKEQSSLPFSQKNITHSRSLIDLYNLNKAQTKSKPKNIADITNRLYVKKCSETIDSWNKKVLEVNIDKNLENCKKSNLLTDYKSSNIKQLTETEALPFMYFPVRMSNAAILREKQIRAEIMAREEREKRAKQEDLKKRINNDILHKLKDLIPPSEEKEINEKVKSFRESQIKRQQEYEKELEEIMIRVSEQNLLLERQSKVKQVSHLQSSLADKGSEADENGYNEEESEASESAASTNSISSAES